MNYIAGLFIVLTIAGGIYILASAFDDLFDEKPSSKVKKLFTPGTVIKTYYINNELDMIYTVIGINKNTPGWLDLSYYSPYSGKCLGQTQRLIKGLTEFEEKCEVYRDGLLMAVFERGKEPIFYGLNFKKKIKINIPELNEKHT